MEEYKKEEYASYNVLARKALVFGVPIVPLVLLLFTIVATAFLGVVALGFWRGIIIPICLLIVLFCIRVACSDDSRALEGLPWDLKALLSRLQCKSTVVSFVSSNDEEKYKREAINEFFKNHRNK